MGIPLNKIAETKDITNAIEFLLSEKAGHITMHDLRVDGGATF
ncbi:SDR family oxidoreductase [Vibrio harveyi]|nr:SDR family oxidoreductase [Vibrio harveyi]